MPSCSQSILVPRADASRLQTFALPALYPDSMSEINGCVSFVAAASSSWLIPFAALAAFNRSALLMFRTLQTDMPKRQPRSL